MAMKRHIRWGLIIAFMFFVAYTAVFGLQGDGPTTPPPSLDHIDTKEEKEEKGWQDAKRSTNREEDKDDEPQKEAKGSAKAVASAIDGVNTEHGVPYLHPPFGYNKKRNVKRWEMIYNSIASENREGQFSVVDYGADEGYFSISTAFAFPEARVIALDMGGVGGSIWKKDHDVLKVQEAKAREYKVGDRFTMCQAAAKQHHFFDLTKAGTGHDYQFVLSVFHWFTMEDRKSFEEVLVALLKNAKTTFIELPIAGDYGPRFMKQVGSKYFTKWYDGRSDIHQIITDSLKSQGTTGSVSKIGSVKWLPGDKKKNERDWDREVFRVDMQDSPADFDCKSHFSVYSCAEKTTPSPVAFSRCP